MKRGQGGSYCGASEEDEKVATRECSGFFPSRQAHPSFLMTLTHAMSAAYTHSAHYVPCINGQAMRMLQKTIPG